MAAGENAKERVETRLKQISSLAQSTWLIHIRWEEAGDYLDWSEEYKPNPVTTGRSRQEDEIRPTSKWACLAIQGKNHKLSLCCDLVRISVNTTGVMCGTEKPWLILKLTSKFWYLRILLILSHSKTWYAWGHFEHIWSSNAALDHPAKTISG